MLSDDCIIDLYFDRSEDAITETSNKYGGYVKKIAMNILGDFEDAMECENDAYLALWNTIPPNRPESFLAFLGKIVRNIALGKFEYKSAQKRNQKLCVILDELEECIGTKESVEDEILTGELTRMINSFLEDLKENRRIMFVKRYWYGMSVKTIAEEMDISESKVKTTLFRIRED